MQLNVDGLCSLTVSPSTTFGALVEELWRAHPALPRVVGDDISVVIAIDRDRWAQLEASPTRTLAEWLGDCPLDAVFDVRLAVAPRCMHGSPAVPGRGYACGWC